MPQYGSQQGDCDRDGTDAGSDRYESDRYESDRYESDRYEEDDEGAREAVREDMDEAEQPAPAPRPAAVETAAQPDVTTTEKAVPVQEAASEASTPAASEPPLAVQAPGQQWEGRPSAADTAGAELTAYVPAEGAGVEDASALTEVTLDAPVKLATTGAEAAALTAAAGALVIGGAGSLLVARRSPVRV